MSLRRRRRIPDGSISHLVREDGKSLCGVTPVNRWFPADLLTVPCPNCARRMRELRLDREDVEITDREIDSRVARVDIDDICKRRNVLVFLTCGYSDGEFVSEWQTSGPGYNNHAAGFTNDDDCLRSLHNWLKGRDNDE